MIRMLLVPVLSLALVINSYAQTLYISTGFTPPVSDFFRLVLEELDHRLPDIDIQFQVLPAERSLLLVDKGTNDGECCRIPQFVLKTHPNLVPVRESFYSVRFNVFARADSAHIERFEDLRPFSVGTVKGWKAAVNNLQRIEPSELHIVTHPSQLFRMLNDRRIDYAVMGYMSGMHSIRQLGFDQLQVQQPPLVEKPLYLLLADKHRALIPLISDTIKAMLDDGSIQRIHERIMRTPRTS